MRGGGFLKRRGEKISSKRGREGNSLNYREYPGFGENRKKEKGLGDRFGAGRNTSKNQENELSAEGVVRVENIE